MTSYLLIRSGAEKGRQFLLDRDRPSHLGRGRGCEILLSDPSASRFHAVVFFEDDSWHLRDTSSRNGTRVNGQKADQVRLGDRSKILVGSTELQLLEASPEADTERFNSATVIKEVASVTNPWLSDEKNRAGQIASAGHLLDLYTLSLQLLRQGNVDSVIDLTLDLLRDRTGADIVGVTYDMGDGRLKPQRSAPADCMGEISVGRSLQRRVVGDGESIWLNHEQDSISAAPEVRSGNWADAIHVPLEGDGANLGAIHLFRQKAGFTDEHFDLSVATGRLLAFAMTRVMERDSLRADRNRIADRNADSNELIGESSVMDRLKARLTRVARASGAVLIRGESGAGKELVARAVHRASPRAKRPMLAVNCAAIPRELMESQLFGHKKGAFTGADNDHAGWFQQAHTGTLFLDEIGELTLEGQAKLLRILEGHPFLPVGATEEVMVDVRVVAATNRDLSEFVREKQFREDLFYRLSVFELMVPPLRERGDDIPRLIHHFLDHFTRQHGRLDLQIAEEAMSSMKEYSWPGNVRQLRNVIDSAVVMADDPEITTADLGLRDAGVSRVVTLRIDEWEKRLIRMALDRCDGSVPEAAKLLGVSRATAYRKITEYEIQR
ncbi:MAG: sigma 54-interacting transcriptional regulator [Planctomycetota bacterium]|nr:sigma 54-interacting transcriptional regulator [Planctomycetota bacterium]